MRKTFDDWDQDYYPESALSLYDALVDRAMRLMRLGPGASVLDAGCGTGVHAVRMAQRGITVTALDISDVALERAAQHAKLHGVDHLVTLTRGNIEQLPFANCAFDAVFCWGVLSHVHDLGTALSELIRVLVPAGGIAFGVTNITSLDHTIESSVRAILGRPLPNYERTRFGYSGWSTMNGAQLFNSMMDVEAMIGHMQDLGCRRVYRGPGQLTELQRRLKSRISREALTWLNKVYFTLRLPSGAACSNLVVFQKDFGPRDSQVRSATQSGHR